MTTSIALIRQINEVEPHLRDVLYSILEEMERQQHERVGKDDFAELRQIVAKLAMAQDKTEKEVAKLALAQEKTEIEVAKLAMAQEKTEKEIAKLARGVQDVHKQMGGLSHAVGYGIEDRLMPFIPAFARQTFGLDVQSTERTFIETSPGSHDEINILAKGVDSDGQAYLIGECKAQPGKKDADRFHALLLRLEKILPGRIYPLLVGYSIHPTVQGYIHQRHPGIKTALTYEIERAGTAG